MAKLNHEEAVGEKAFLGYKAIAKDYFHLMEECGAYINVLLKMGRRDEAEAFSAFLLAIDDHSHITCGGSNGKI